MKRPTSPSNGFTIIEVLIVLAIAGLIIIIVFFAVPALRRNARNTERKHAVRTVLAELNNYVTTLGKPYPDSPAQFCDFISNSGVRAIDPGLGSCSPVLDGTADCVLVHGSRFDICYHPRSSSHSYVGPDDQISIEHGHWCGSDPTNTSEFPITDGGSADSSLHDYAVWTALERANVTCVSTR